MALGSTQPLVKIETFLEAEAAGTWGWRPHHLHVPNVMKICEPKPPGNLWAPPGLLRDSFTFTVYLGRFEMWFWWRMEKISWIDRV